MDRWTRRIHEFMLMTTKSNMTDLIRVFEGLFESITVILADES